MEITKYIYNGKIFTRVEIYKELGISQVHAYELIKKKKSTFLDLPILLGFETRLEICDKEEADREFVETYRGFNIIKKVSDTAYIIDSHRTLQLTSVVVAKRCIDTYLNHMELKGEINYEQ